MKRLFIGFTSILVLLFIGCKKTSTDALSNPSIKIDNFVTITPSQGFKSHVTANKISSEILNDLYSDIKSFLNLGTINENSVEIIIDSSIIPQNENIRITFSLSDNFINNIPSGYTVAICSELSWKESLDTGTVLHVYNTVFNKTSKTASMYAYNDNFILSKDGLNFLHGVFSFVTIPDNTASRGTSNNCSDLNWSWPTNTLGIAHPFSEPRNATCSNGQPRGIHGGLDIVKSSAGILPIGTPVFAAADGKVITATTSTSAGKYIVIEHKPNVKTRYLHLNSISVSQGETVYAGQEIAKSGNTGSSSAPHLHFDYSPGYGTAVCSNLFVDPLPCISECNGLCLSCNFRGGPCGIDTNGNPHCIYPVNFNISALGGTPPYIYKLNNGAWQNSSSFTINSPGTYVWKVRDSKGCEASHILKY